MSVLITQRWSARPRLNSVTLHVLIWRAFAAGLRRLEVHTPWYAVLCGTQLWLVIT